MEGKSPRESSLFAGKISAPPPQIFTAFTSAGILDIYLMIRNNNEFPKIDVFTHSPMYLHSISVFLIPMTQFLLSL